MNKQWLQAKTFGMPRWAFLTLLAGGIILGLWLRARRKATEDGTSDVYEGTDTLSGSTDPGLAGVGVVSPPGGVYPVSSPVIPEGLTELIGSLSGVIVGQGETLAAVPNAFEPQTPVVNVTLPATGGGPPKAPPKSVPGTRAEYLRRLREIRDRHGANSAEVKAFRARHPSGLA